MTDYTKSAAFALNPTHCSVCGRPLVDGTSVEHGIGPVCRGKVNYEDAYPISDARAQEMLPVLKTLSDVSVSDKAIEAVFADDSRKAVNVINRAVAVWVREGGPTDDIMTGIKVMHMMGYDKLAERIGDRVADISITVEAGRVFLDTPFNNEFVNAVKAIQGRKWDGDNKRWSVPVSKKEEAWKAILSTYKGKIGTGPKGMFRIGA